MLLSAYAWNQSLWAADGLVLQVCLQALLALLDDRRQAPAESPGVLCCGFGVLCMSGADVSMVCLNLEQNSKTYCLQSCSSKGEKGFTTGQTPAWQVRHSDKHLPVASAR